MLCVIHNTKTSISWSRNYIIYWSTVLKISCGSSQRPCGTCWRLGIDFGCFGTLPRREGILCTNVRLGYPLMLLCDKNTNQGESMAGKQACVWNIGEIKASWVRLLMGSWQIISSDLNMWGICSTGFCLIDIIASVFSNFH